MLASVDKCSGCSACFAVCPKDAISMVKDAEGFLQPKVDPERCVNCRLCEKVCPVLHPWEKSAADKCYAVVTKDRDLLMKSTSGGVFSELAKPILERGGCVFGCVLEKPALVACHVRADSEEELAPMRGSKYVQSEVRNTFRECREQLDSGRPVLYSGTPCQIAGLKHFLGKEYGNLLTVEVICHGASSPDVFGVLKARHEKSDHCHIIGAAFRNKDPRFRFTLRLMARTDDGSEKQFFEKDFFGGFAHNLNLRRSCYGCAAREGRSHADFTIADFWQIEKCVPGSAYGEGTSLAIPHTQRAVDALHLIATNVNVSATISVNQAIDGKNESYRKSPSMPEGRTRYMADFRHADIGRLTRRIVHGPAPLFFAKRLCAKLRMVVGL